MALRRPEKRLSSGRTHVQAVKPLLLRRTPVPLRSVGAPPRLGPGWRGRIPVQAVRHLIRYAAPMPTVCEPAEGSMDPERSSCSDGESTHARPHSQPGRPRSAVTSPKTPAKADSIIAARVSISRGLGSEAALELERAGRHGRGPFCRSRPIGAQGRLLSQRGRNGQQACADHDQCDLNRAPSDPTGTTATADRMRIHASYTVFNRAAIRADVRLPEPCRMHTAARR